MIKNFIADLNVKIACTVYNQFVTSNIKQYFLKSGCRCNIFISSGITFIILSIT